jgi:hypothetical protein
MEPDNGQTTDAAQVSAEVSHGLQAIQAFQTQHSTYPNPASNLLYLIAI